MWSVLKIAFQGWSRHNVTTLGAALAYYSVFSLGPLLLIVTAVAGLLFGEDAVRGELTGQFRNLLGPVGSQAVEAMLKGAANRQSGTFAAVGGAVLLIIAALAVVVQLKNALNTIWDVTAAEEASWIAYLRTYFVSLLGVLAVGFLLAVSLVINTALAAVWSSVGSTAALLHLAVSIAVLTILFALLLKWFPDAEVRWREAIIGGLITALLFNIGKSAIAWYITWEGEESTYGAAASVVVLLVWVYYSAQIFLLGAEFTRAMALEDQSSIRRAPETARKRRRKRNQEAACSSISWP